MSEVREGRHWTEEETLAVKNGIEKGLSYGAIALALGRTTAAIQVHASKKGFKRNAFALSTPEAGVLVVDKPKRKTKWIGKASRSTPPGFLAIQLSRMIGVSWRKEA